MGIFDHFTIQMCDSITKKSFVFILLLFFSFSSNLFHNHSVYSTDSFCCCCWCVCFFVGRNFHFSNIKQDNFEFRFRNHFQIWSDDDNNNLSVNIFQYDGAREHEREHKLFVVQLASLIKAKRLLIMQNVIFLPIIIQLQAQCSRSVTHIVPFECHIVRAF